MGQAHLLRSGAREPALVQRAEKILAGADRCARIVRNFLALARQRPPERATVALNSIVEEAVELLGYDLRTSNVEVTLDLGDDRAGDLGRRPPDPSGRREPRGQRDPGDAPDGHAAPARDQDPDDGRADPSLHRGERQRTRHLRRRSGADLRALLHDQAPGRGTGLGLSLCRRTLEEHGGTITVESEVGHGATFRLELPVVARPTPAVEAAAPRSLTADRREGDLDRRRRGRHRRHPGRGTAGRRASDRDRGQRRDGPRDARRARVRSGSPAIPKMPRLDGEHFYAEVERRFPHLRHRIVFVTGDILNREKRAFLERTGAPHVLKPFDLPEVRQLVHRMLIEPGAEPRPEGSWAPARSTPFTILVVDDDALVLSTLTELLRAHGHRVLEATKGRDGLELARAERPRPDPGRLSHARDGRPGGGRCAEVRRRDAGIPTVAFTSGTAAEANQLVRAGCIGFIPKPFEPGTLPELVAQFLRATVARDRRAAALPPRSRPATATDPRRPSKIVRFCQSGLGTLRA